MNNNSSSGIITNEDNFSKPLKPAALLSVTTVTESSYKRDGDADEKEKLNRDDFELVTKVNVQNDATDAKRKATKPINYAAKKTVAQGMMDLALLTSNANQLKNLIDYHQIKDVTFYFILFLIMSSLLLQLAVGVSLIFKGRFDTKGKDKAAAARVNKYIMSGVFLITIINIFIAVFSTGPTARNPPAPIPPPAPR